jgi:AcrR family transcriptional regulator
VDNDGRAASGDRGKAGAPKFRRRAEARPDEVLDAALKLFIAKGFAATRVEDIAKEAGLSKGAVYLYFPSKEAIIEGLVRRAVVPVANSALRFVRSHEGDPRQTVALVMRMVGARLSEPGMIAIPRLLLREMINFPELAAMYKREVLDRVIPVVEGVIARGIAEGYLRPVDPSLTIRSLVGPILIHIMLAEIFGIHPEGGLALEQMIENHLSILFDGLSRHERGAS